ncbi:ABC transporter substrate-binding protein [Sphaerisporangium siamense]|uniref:Putative spermidine/putrescine transport system substrate-binding protein n=1 Tax=Sphaerisporangium siamense TaxID=795645 RepID=A0A7W7D7Z8_9ACTN|nr:extracellular solute-binding protein [Sphaerisporangium siamense]MBB4701955.1 putative spermidine/putrescine transport system substrate-binding protein [Sphaerisporangium siamense]GII84132.1 ABC transporter substrate-binding protein [Sphaerisporangium siamense]
MQSSRTRIVGLAAVLTVATSLGAACGSAPATGAQTGASSSTANSAATATSAADLGGLDKLVEAAKKEGQLNVITLPPDWANYGEIIKTFGEKYGIKVNSENPDGSSADEINAVKTRKGQDRAPDVLDLGTAFALSGAREGLFAPYKVRSFDKIPEGQKDAQGNWYNDYGGYVSIGCDAKRIPACPQTFADLLKPEYKGKVAMNGNPTKSGSAFAGVFAAALADGGSFDDIQPGLDFFKKLKAAGNYNPVESTPATVQNGETPISIDWDYLNSGYTDQFAAKGVDWKVTVPADGKYANFYAQAINKWAPHPAAARLWEEFLYSTEGQNLWLKGYARPVLLPSMQSDGSADAALVAKLPKVEGTPEFPTDAQVTKAKEVLAAGWGAAVSG